MGPSIDSSWESTRLKERIAELEAKLAAHDEALKVAEMTLRNFSLGYFVAREALAKIEELLK